MSRRRTENGLAGGGLNTIQACAKAGSHAERPIPNHRNSDLAKVCLACTKEPCAGTIRRMKQRRKELEEKTHEK